MLLVSHDRYLIRNTAEELVAVRDGKVVHHHELDESVLSPGTPVLTARSSAAPGSGGSSGGGSGSGAKANKKSKPAQGGGKASGGKASGGQSGRAADSAGAGNGTKPGVSSQKLRNLRKNVSRLEKKAADAETLVSDLERQLADPDVYADKDRMNDLIDQHETAKRRSDRLLLEWEEASTALEKAEG